jgi:predicted Rossmann-fold nucleotide-binding protein
MKEMTTAPGIRRRRVVAVLGSGELADPTCVEVGELIAKLGFDLLTGAGRGVMEAVSRAFFDTTPREGIVVGIVPAVVAGLESLEAREIAPVEYRPRSGYPNPWVELAIYTHLPDSGDRGTLRTSRNHINVLSADAIVALPGGAGTAAELFLAVRYRKPVVAYGDHRRALPQGIRRAASRDELRDFLRSIPEPTR